MADGADNIGRASLLVVAAAAAAVIVLPAVGPPEGGAALGEAPSRLLPELMDPKTVTAIDRGLTYLVGTQRRDGSWGNPGSYSQYPAVMTALPGMALLAGGSTPESGPYARNVTKAMNYLLKLGEASHDGLLASGGRSMYGHGFATLFLAQCYGMDLNTDMEKRLGKVLKKAVALMAKSQSKMTSRFGKPCGGWYYTPGSNNDEGSVTVTQLQALRACRNVGIKVPRVTIDKAVEYLRHCQQADGGICYSARSRGSSRPPISAAAIACFYAAGVYDRQAGGSGAEAEMVAKLVTYVKGRVSVGGSHSGAWSHFFYAHFYMGSAMYQRGGEDWKNYYRAMKSKLLAMQNPDGSWSGGVGTTFRTAVASMLLQLPYGYMPIWQR